MSTIILEMIHEIMKCLVICQLMWMQDLPSHLLKTCSLEPFLQTHRMPDIQTDVTSLASRHSRNVTLITRWARCHIVVTPAISIFPSVQVNSFPLKGLRTKAIIELMLANQLVSILELKSHHLNEQKAVPKGSSSERHCLEPADYPSLGLPSGFLFSCWDLLTHTLLFPLASSALGLISVTHILFLEKFALFFYISSFWLIIGGLCSLASLE